MPWGYHLLLDCTAGTNVSSRENIIAFVKELVRAIDMEAYGEPWCERFATHDITKSGYSLCQMITTSNITGHFVDGDGNFYIDVFSCKEFDCDKVCEVVQFYFAPKKIEQKFIYREA